MGYSHAWKRPKVIDEGVYSKIQKDMLSVLELLPPECPVTALPIRIMDGYGIYAPAISSHHFYFNGDAAENLDCEAFAFNRVMVPWEWQKPDQRGLYYTWCKTQRLPYDLAVCACLLIASYHLKDQFVFQTDAGSLSGPVWLSAIETASQALETWSTLNFSPQPDLCDPSFEVPGPGLGS